MEKREIKLRTALKANGLFSLFSGMSLIFWSKPIASFMAIEKTSVLSYIGFALLLFMGFVMYIAYKKDMSAVELKWVILQDWVWVVLSALLLIFNPFGISNLGLGLIFLIALVVLFFAIFQMKGLAILKLNHK